EAREGGGGGRAPVPDHLPVLAADQRRPARGVYQLTKRFGAARWSLFFLVAVGRGTVLDPISPVECEQLLVTLAGLAARSGPPVVSTTEAPHFRRVVFQRGGGTPRAHGLGMRDGNGIMFITHAGEVYPSGFLALCVCSVAL